MPPRYATRAGRMRRVSRRPTKRTTRSKYTRRTPARRRRISGRGSYSTGRSGAPFRNKSDVIHRGQNFTKPKFSTDIVHHDAGGMMIRHQEYVQTIYGNEATSLHDNGEAKTVKPFQTVTFGVNPGLAQVFPMLAQFATNFENYEMKQCVFHYETLLDEGVFQSSNGQVGDILMYSHINPGDTDLQSVSEFIQAGGSISRSTKGVVGGVECSPKQLYGLPNEGINKVRTGPIINGVLEDHAEYDQASFQLAVSNTPTQLAGQPIGRLYVSYTVKLIKPKLGSILGRGSLKDLFSAWQHEVPVALGSTIPLLPQRKITTEVGGGWFEHKKNQIGCELRKRDRVDAAGGTTEELQLVLPKWFQGTLQVDFKFVTSRKGTGSHVIIPTQRLPFLTATGSGNVTPFFAQTCSPGDETDYCETASTDRSGGMGAGAGADDYKSGKHIVGWDTSTWKVSLPNSVDNIITFTGDPDLLHKLDGIDDGGEGPDLFSPHMELVVSTINDWEYAPDHHVSQGNATIAKGTDGLKELEPVAYTDLAE